MSFRRPRSLYREPIRVVGTLAVLTMAAGCAYFVESRIHPVAVESVTFCSQYVAEGKLVEAEQRAKLALEYSPKYAEAYNCLGLVYYHSGRLELAIDHFKRAIAFKDDFAEALNNLGALYLDERRDHAQAEDLFREALAIDPGYLPARGNLAMCLSKRGEHDEAREQYLRCLELDPGDCDCRMGMGVLAIQQGDWAGCRAHYDRYTQVCGGDANGFHNLGYCFMQLGRCDEGRGAFTQALALDPDHQEARKNLTLAVDCAGKQDGAVRRLLAKVRHDPGDAELHFELAALYEDRQQLDAARAELHEVIDLRPDHVLAYYRLARLYDRIPQAQETIRYCQELVDRLRGERLASERAWCIGRVRELQLGVAR